MTAQDYWSALAQGQFVGGIGSLGWDQLGQAGQQAVNDYYTKTILPTMTAKPALDIWGNPLSADTAAGMGFTGGSTGTNTVFDKVKYGDNQYTQNQAGLYDKTPTLPGYDGIQRLPQASALAAIDPQLAAQLGITPEQALALANQNNQANEEARRAADSANAKQGWLMAAAGVGGGLAGAYSGLGQAGAGTGASGYTGTAAELAADGLGGVAPSGFTWTPSAYTGTAAELAADGLGGVAPSGFGVSTSGPGAFPAPTMWDAVKAGASSLFGGSGGGSGGVTAGQAAGAGGSAIGSLFGGGGSNMGGLLAAGAGALMGGVNGSKEAGTTTTTNAPWAPMQPYLLAAGQQAANVYDQARTMPQGTQNALNAAQGVINQQMNNPLFQQSQNVASGLLGGQMQGVSIPGTFGSMGALDPTAAYQNQLSGKVNPYVDQMAQSITNQVNRNTLENVMPSIRSGAQAAGQYGSSRQGIAEGLAASRAQQDLGSSLSNLYGSAFENAQGRQAAAAGQLGSMGVSNAQNNNTQRLAQFNTGANLWNQGNNTQNTAIQNALGVANYPTQYQWDQLSNYSKIVNPMAGMGGSQSTPYYTNPTAGAIGGALTGAQIYKSIFS